MSRRRALALFDRIASFPALLAATQRAARGKRQRGDAAAFLFHLERNVLFLTDALQDGTWQPGCYRNVTIREPKLRHISIAPFADRVVHQAIHAVVGPILAKSYISHTFASIPRRGQHKAVACFEGFRNRHAWVLRGDILRYFPAIDHAILKADLRRVIGCPQTLWLLDTIIDGSNPQEPVHLYFPGDDVFTPFERARGLPLGNLTSQMLGNFYLSGFDHYVKEVLRIRGYVRYLDDIAVFGASEPELAATRKQLQCYLNGRRLQLHPNKTFVQDCRLPIHFLGFELLPGGYRRLPAENVARAMGRITRLRQAWQLGKIDEAQVRQSLGGWVAHARHADTWQLRSMLFPLGWFAPTEEPRRLRRGVSAAGASGRFLEQQSKESALGQPQQEHAGQP